MTYWVPRFAALGLSAALVFTAGCGGAAGKKVVVKGKVTIDGKAADGVVLSFYNPTESVAVGIVTSKPDGSFEVMFNSTAGEGNYKISATKWQMKNGAPLPNPAEGMDEEQLRLSGAAINVLPEKYSSADRSGLTVVLQPGTNEKDIPLASR